MVHLGHDFLGREALVSRKDDPHRVKVTLEWNNQDVFDVMHRAVGTETPRTKFISLPVPMYATFEYDEVQLNGSPIGISQWSSYSSNAGAVLSTALIAPEQAVMGQEVTLLWGEPGSKRRTVEEHEVVGIRAKISPVPYFDKSIKHD
jgi:glycine cleavage system aminomethyltransferase T